MVRVVPAARFLERVLGEACGEPLRRHRGEIDRRFPDDNPLSHDLTNRRRYGEPTDTAAAHNEEAADAWHWADYVFAIGRHGRKPASVLADFRGREYWELVANAFRKTLQHLEVERHIFDLEARR
jgi:hypothetical protein